MIISVRNLFILNGPIHIFKYDWLFCCWITILIDQKTLWNGVYCNKAMDKTNLQHYRQCRIVQEAMQARV